MSDTYNPYELLEGVTFEDKEPFVGDSGYTLDELVALVFQMLKDSRMVSLFEIMGEFGLTDEEALQVLNEVKERYPKP